MINESDRNNISWAEYQSLGFLQKTKDMIQKLHILPVLCLLACILFYNKMTANSLHPTTTNFLYEHLLEVNIEWATQEINPEDYCNDIAFESETARIQMHLQLVEQMLRNKNNTGLSKKQFEKRNDLLDVLKEYHQAGIFPQNTGHADRQPYFIDKLGTACAVGYLALQDGQEALVNKINQENNFAYIREMNYPQLNAWAINNGFTMAELAWIQPGYPSQSLPWESVGGGQGHDGKIHVMKTDFEEELLYFAGDFTRIDGVEANNIIAWDGTSWETLTNGIEGEIFDIIFDEENNMYAAGNFSLNNEPDVNIVRWDGSTWMALQAGNMGGVIYALEYQDGHIYAGGNFTQIDGMPVSNLGYYDLFAGTWSANGAADVQGGFSVNNTVRDLEFEGQQLYVAGDFTLTGVDAGGTSINQHDVSYIAYWENGNWHMTVEGDNQPVHNINIFGETILVGGDLNVFNSFAELNLGEWRYYNTDYYGYPVFHSQDDGMVHGFIEIADKPYAYGGFDYYPLIGHYTHNLYPTGFSYSSNPIGINNIDKSITAMTWFKNEIYAAGSFTQIENQELPGLAKINMEISSNENLAENNTKIYYATDQLFIKTNLKDDAVLQIFNMQGQFIKTIPIPKGKQDFTTCLGELSSSAYVYSLLNSSVKISGKFIVY